ncbi:MAG: phosphatidylglycerol lysyltransferase domain-containing protein [Chitinophagaceae bacterium]
MFDKLIKSIPKASKSHWREIFAIFLLLVGIYFFRSQRHELLSIAHSLKSADPQWFYLGVFITVLYVLLQAGMYVSSFAAVQSKLSWPQGIELFLKRNFLSVFLPAGGISSLAYAPSAFKKKNFTKLQIGQASAIYAVIGLLTVFIIGLPLLVFAFFQRKNIADSGLALLVLSIILLVLFYLIYSIRKKGKLYDVAVKRAPKVVDFAEQFLAIDYSSVHLRVTIFYSLLIEVCGIAHLFIAANALGFPISLEASGLAYVATVLLMIISPFLRGLGAVELSMVYILHLFGLPSASALAITFLYRFFEFWLPLVAGLFSFLWRGRFLFLRLFPSFLVFALGIVNILSVITPPFAQRLRLLKHFIPVASIHESNILVLLIGFILLITAAFLLRGQRNAWIVAMVLSVLSLVGHIFKALDYEEALLAASVVIVLAISSNQYRLSSNKKLIRIGIVSIVLVFAACLSFGLIGFYFLQKRHFGIDFSFYQSVQFTLQNFLLLHNDDLNPKTTFATEFILLLQTLGFFSWGFLFFVLVKPIFKQKKSESPSIEKASNLLQLYGNSAVDYFKINRDKLLFFSDLCDGFVAYRIANGFAIVLEEPVCADNNKIPVLQEFEQHCRKMSLRTAYYRVDESNTRIFDHLRKQQLLIGQEALLQLASFSLEGRDKKSLRNALNSLTKKGFTNSVLTPPLSQVTLDSLRAVSDEWLLHYNKKETIFSQGMFDEEEIAEQTVIVVKDAEENIKAFLNIVPDFAPGEVTYDLIRKTADAPGGCMDALILSLINHAKDKGFTYLNLGMVPMTGIEEPHNAAEHLLSYGYRKMKKFRHYTGLREFKEKYASSWVNKYLVYENDLDLIQLPVALNKVMQPI